MEIARSLGSLVFIYLLIGRLSAQIPVLFRLGYVPHSGSADSVELSNEIGTTGGTLVFSQRSEPKTLNPLIALDTSSREIIGLLQADLLHINSATQQVEPALAANWTMSGDGLRYTMHLRRNLRFSDGQPCDADDVLFSFRSYLDERVHAPQRDLLLIAGRPIDVRKIDQATVVFTLARRYAAAERLFDGIAILPRHLLERSLNEGNLGRAWGLNSRPDQVAGLGAFRLKEYVPGQKLTLERNPFYWNVNTRGQQLPYLQEMVSLFTAGGNSEALRFDAGDTDIISRLSSPDYAMLARDQKKRHFRLRDLGPGLEFSFLFFNQNKIPSNGLPGIAERQAWFKQAAFRKAISWAIDRDALVQLAFQGRAYPLFAPGTPANQRWVNRKIPHPPRSLAHSRELLKNAGFSWTTEGSLCDERGRKVEFSLAIIANNTQQVQMGTMMQQDLKELGIEVTLDLLESHTFIQRITSSYKYEAALIMLVDGDADPNSEMSVLTSRGNAHFWNRQAPAAQEPWQVQIDQLMEQQLVAASYADRKKIYDRVQQLVWDQMPVVYLVSPHILVGAKDRVGNFRAAILGNYTLWNAEQLFIRQ